MGTVTISIERYDELISLEARVNMLIASISNNGYANTDDTLSMIGTDFAWEVLHEIKEKREELKKLNESYQAIKEEVSE